MSHGKRFTNYQSRDIPAPSKPRCRAYSAIPNSRAPPQRARRRVSSIRQAQAENDFAAGPQHKQRAGRQATPHTTLPRLDATTIEEVPTTESTAPLEKAHDLRPENSHPSRDRGFSSNPATSQQTTCTFAHA